MLASLTYTRLLLLLSVCVSLPSCFALSSPLLANLHRPHTVGAAGAAQLASHEREVELRSAVVQSDGSLIPLAHVDSIHENAHAHAAAKTVQSISQLSDATDGDVQAQEVDVLPKLGRQNFANARALILARQVQKRAEAERDLAARTVGPAEDFATPPGSIGLWFGHAPQGVGMPSGSRGTVLGATKDKKTEGLWFQLHVPGITRRLSLQDAIVLGVLAGVYAATLAIGSFMLYRLSGADQRVKYFADPRISDLTVGSTDLGTFLHVFNRKPFAMLRVVGLTKAPPGSNPHFPDYRQPQGTSQYSLHQGRTTPREALLGSARGSHTTPRGSQVFWKGAQHHVAFNVALEIEPLLTGDGALSQADVCKLQSFLCTGNCLETMTLSKHVEWEGFEMLKQQIAQRILESGFDGAVEVQIVPPTEEVKIYQNAQWANFLHNRTTKTIMALSVVGGFFYLPYVWLRSKNGVVRSHFKVEASATEFWPLVRDGLCREGFKAPSE